MFSDGLIVREVEVMEFRAVVVTNEAGELLEMFGLELNDGGRAEAMGLLASRDERLAEETAERFASVETQETGPRSEAEDFLRPWRAQPLEVDGEQCGVEVFALRRWWKGTQIISGFG